MMKKTLAVLLLMALAMPMALTACQGESETDGDSASPEGQASPAGARPGPGNALALMPDTASFAVGAASFNALWAKMEEMEEATGWELGGAGEMAADLGIEGVNTAPELMDRLGIDRERSMAVFAGGDAPINIRAVFALPLADEDAFVEVIEGLGAFEDLDIENFDAPARFAHDVQGSPMYYVVDVNTAYVSNAAPMLESVGARVVNPNPPHYMQEPRIGTGQELVVIASPASIVEMIAAQAGQQARALESMLSNADELVLAMDLSQPGLLLRAAMRMNSEMPPATGLSLHSLMPSEAIALIDASIPAGFKNAARQSIRDLAPSPGAANEMEGLFNMIASQLGEEFVVAVAPNATQPMPSVVAAAEIQSSDTAEGLLGLGGVDTTAPVETYAGAPIYSTGQGMPTPTPVYIALLETHLIASNDLGMLKQALDKKAEASDVSPLPPDLASRADYAVAWVDVRRALEMAMPVMGVMETPDLSGIQGESSLVIEQEGPWLQAVLSGTSVVTAAPIMAPIMLQAGGGMTELPPIEEPAPAPEETPAP